MIARRLYGAVWPLLLPLVRRYLRKFAVLLDICVVGTDIHKL